MKRYIIASFAILLLAACGFARQPERGYRGFAEWTNRIYHDSYNYSYRSNTHYSPGIATSHGYQFNPWLFAGAGIDLTLSDIGILNHHAYSLNQTELAIFAEGRTDLKFGKFTPFADIRLGWNTSENGKAYFSPSIGYRFNWGRKVGINIGIGYTLDTYRYEKHIQGTTPEGYTIYVPTGEYYNWNKSSFTFRVGIDF
ncbi:MAG: hypothetical protein K2L22_04450 [Muribaculaceae bacterium]|nr:hypothetical protein [Muribaculaceae bacterium]